jgi:hypothetical protein
MKRTKHGQAELELLERFAWGELSLDSMQARLSIMIGRPIRKNPMMRHFGVNGLCAQRILITRAHLENILRKRRSKQVSDQDLIDWSTMIMINDVYHWDSNDDPLSEWINRLHLDLFAED